MIKYRVYTNMVFFYLYLLYIELLHFISQNKRNKPLFYFYHDGINHDFLSFTYSDFCKNKLVSNMRTILFKKQTRTEFNLYSSILTSLLDIILINDIIMHMMNYMLQTMQFFAYSET